MGNFFQETGCYNDNRDCHRKYGMVGKPSNTQYLNVTINTNVYKLQILHFHEKLAMLARMVACLPLVQQVQGLIPGGVVNFHPRG